MRAVVLSAVLAVGFVAVPMAANDLDVVMALRGNGEWTAVAPASSTSYLITVPYDPAEWAVDGQHSLLIELFDGDGNFLGSDFETHIALDKWTGEIAPFHLSMVMGIEREDRFPADRKMGRVVLIDGVRYRKVNIQSPITVRTTVDGGVPGAQLTYGVALTIGTK